MKKFDLEAAKRGAAVCTMSGRNVRILCCNRKGETPVIALVDYEDHETLYAYNEYGIVPDHLQSWLPLMMRDDDYLEKLERGEYDHIAVARKMVGPAIKQNLTTDREYWRRVYAGRAMQGIVSALDMNAPIAEDGVADMACVFADALIEELEKTDTK